MSDAYLYVVPEGLDALRLKADEPWSHCRDCTGSNTMWIAAQGVFTCKDCCNEWTTEFNFYDHEPETNPDR